MSQQSQNTPTKPFNERLQSSLADAAQAILRDIPEVDALAVSITYKPALGHSVQPAGLTFQREADLHDPVLRARIAVGAAQLALTMTNRVAQGMQEASMMLAELTQELDAKREEAQARRKQD